MITRPLILLAALLLAACSNLDLNTDPRCKRYLSTRDMDEIRALLVSRPDIKKPLWGLVCDDRDHVTAKTGGARGEDLRAPRPHRGRGNAGGEAGAEPAQRGAGAGDDPPTAAAGGVDRGGRVGAGVARPGGDAAARPGDRGGTAARARALGALRLLAPGRRGGARGRRGS